MCRLCYGELRDVPTPKLAILPWGATEPHNLHLPYTTDLIVARELALDAAAKLLRDYDLLAAVLPGIALGSQNPGQWDKPFCIHSSYQTQASILGDTVASLSRQGIQRLVVVNGHGGNSFRNMVRDLAFQYPEFLVAIANTFDIVPQQGYFDHHDDHAGEMESSLMMYYRPKWVRSDRAGEGRSKSFAVQSLNDRTAWVPRNWNRMTHDTGIGDPRQASAEKGARYAAAIVDRLTQLFRELCTDEDIYRP